MGVSGFYGAHIRARADQYFYTSGVGVLTGNMERRPTRFIARLNGSASIDQGGDTSCVGVFAGNMERRPTYFIARLNISIGIDQDSNTRYVTLCRTYGAKSSHSTRKGHVFGVHSAHIRPRADQFCCTSGAA